NGGRLNAIELSREVKAEENEPERTTVKLSGLALENSEDAFVIMFGAINSTTTIHAAYLEPTHGHSGGFLENFADNFANGLPPADFARVEGKAGIITAKISRKRFQDREVITADVT